MRTVDFQHTILLDTHKLLVTINASALVHGRAFARCGDVDIKVLDARRNDITLKVMKYELEFDDIIQKVEEELHAEPL